MYYGAIRSMGVFVVNVDTGADDEREDDIDDGTTNEDDNNTDCREYDKAE